MMYPVDSGLLGSNVLSIGDSRRFGRDLMPSFSRKNAKHGMDRGGM
jgi:hypothetical protein